MEVNIMHREEIRRVIQTDSYTEFKEWMDYMIKNNINYKARVQNSSGRYYCSIELFGYDKDEIEEIKHNIGFYFD